ncbi:uncharacterized protein LOC122474446 [Prionailurus bengalensis]|uniref:uncharacterized protein LOC122474446 n=1 Tax=Prionailurus bengalensis TaxID=37029 RepID=UPI001CA9325E|nr:uncharacterized protein LOC122474446 [Prionailurus bengalensis]
MVAGPAPPEETRGAGRKALWVLGFRGPRPLPSGGDGDGAVTFWLPRPTPGTVPRTQWALGTRGRRDRSAVVQLSGDPDPKRDPARAGPLESTARPAGAGRAARAGDVSAEKTRSGVLGGSACVWPPATLTPFRARDSVLPTPLNSRPTFGQETHRRGHRSQTLKPPCLLIPYMRSLSKFCWLSLQSISGTVFQTATLILL